MSPHDMFMQAQTGAEVYLVASTGRAHGPRMDWAVSTTLLPLYLAERHSTLCTGNSVGPRVGLDGHGKSHLHRNSIPGPSGP